MALQDFILPYAGDDEQTLTITRWEKNIDDAIAENEVIVEVETTKASIELPSNVSGFLTEQLYAAGDKVKVGEVIARISTEKQKETSDPQAPKKLSTTPWVATNGAHNWFTAGSVYLPSTPTNSPQPIVPATRTADDEDGLTDEDFD